MPDDFPTKLNAAEDKTAAQLEADFLKSVKITVKETDWDELERELAAYNNGDQIIEGIAWEDYDPRERLGKLFEVALALHGEEIGRIVGGAKFDFVDPNALKWIQEYGAQDIKYISDSSRAAIKEIIHRGYADGNTTREMAREIRAHIGLDEARSRTLQKYSENLFAKGKSEAEVWRLMERRGGQLLNARANTIAINEVSEAGANAAYWSTKSACERGVIDPHIYEEFRIITADERTCTQCNSLEGEARNLPDGVYASSGRNVVKLHVKCRCVPGLREIGMKKKESAIRKEKREGFINIICEAKGLKRKDGIIYCPTVPLVEGVFDAWGLPVLREFKEFSKDAKWLLGLTVVTNHEELTPEARRIGQITNPIPRPASLDVSAITQFYEIDLTQREIEDIMSGKPLDGSIAFSCWLALESGDWTDPKTGAVKHYEAREEGPYVFYEYSKVKHGAVTPEDGAGFNLECTACGAKLRSPAHRAVRGNAMSEGQPPAGEPELEMGKQLEAALGEIGVLKEELKALKESQTKITESLTASAKAAVLEKFTAKLKAGHVAEAEKLFEEYQKDPAAWVLENQDKFIQPIQQTKLQGNALGAGGQPWSLEQERAKLKAEGKVI